MPGDEAIGGSAFSADSNLNFTETCIGRGGQGKKATPKLALPSPAAKLSLSCGAVTCAMMVGSSGLASSADPQRELRFARLEFATIPSDQICF